MIRKKGNNLVYGFIAATCILAALQVNADTGLSLPELTIPTGPNVVDGTATIDSRPGQINVNQSSDRAIIEWNTFNLGSRAEANFYQPSANAAILNRVLDSSASHIFGRINANGQVFFSNPQGILFAQGAVLDVGALVATTHSISNENFIAGNYFFERRGATGRIENSGHITAADGGYVALLGPEVLNYGVVNAQLGSILLAGGEHLLLSTAGDGLFDIVVDEGVIETMVGQGRALVSPTGDMVMSTQAAAELRDGTININENELTNMLVERDGRVFVGTQTQIVQEGVLSAPAGLVSLIGDKVYLGVGQTSAAEGGQITIASTALLEGVAGHTLDVGGRKAGSINLDGGAQGSLIISSHFDAASSAGIGGNISVTAAEVALLGAHLNADGSTQGGIINLGGQWQGGGTLRHAEKLLVNRVANLTAQSALGDGGSIVLWSTDYTNFQGSARSAGSTAGGNIEVSSKGLLAFDGDLHAGVGGRVLFDPANITIGNPSGSELTWRREESAFSLGITTIGGNENDFGQSLAIEGTLLAIGLHSQDNNRGAVYLYTGADSANFSALVLQGKLGHVSGATGLGSIPTGENFGEAVAIDNGRLAVGAPQRASNVGRGAVYLFDGVGADFSALNYVKTVSSAAGAVSMPTLDNIEYFGASLDLDGDLLVVGAYNDNAGGPSRGEVYLFSGMNSASFASLAYQNSLTSGSVAVAAGMPVLADGDAFGRSVSIDGGLLAVGAIGDDTGGTDRGAVHLFSGFSTADGSDYSGLTWQGKITSGSTATASGMLAIGDNDEFGYAVDLNGGRLAVGAPGSGFGNTLAGSLYVFSDTGADFSGLKFDTRVRSGEGAIGQPVLTTNEAIGRAVALDANSLVLGGQNAVHFFDVGVLTLSTVGDGLFATNPADNNTISAASITALLDAGTAVTLQANNDILLSVDVIANNASGDGGDFTLQAGRSVTIAANVTTDNGNFSIIANAPAASGVIDAYRSAGAASIDVQPGASLNIGSGAFTAHIQDGAGNTNSASGSLTLRDVVAGSISVVNNIADVTGDLNLFGTITANGSGNALVAAAGAVHLDPAMSLITSSGRWLIYSQTPVDDTIDTLSSANSAIWGRDYSTYAPGAVVEPGNRYIFAVTGAVTLTTADAIKAYGAGATLTGVYSGLPFNGSSYGNAYTDVTEVEIFSTQPTFSSAGSVATASVTGGPYAITASGGVTNTGYSIVYTNTGALTVTPAALTISATVTNRAYDGSNTSFVAPTVLGLLNADTVTGLSQVFDTDDAGVRTLSVVSYTVNDGAAGANYTVTTQTAVGQIDPLALTLAGSVVADKVYDGTISAILTPGSFVGLVGAETLNFAGASALFADEHAGVGRSVTATYSLLDGSNGGLAANYSLAPEILNATITPAPLIFTTIGGEVRAYDGSTTSSIAPTSLGLVAGDTVSALSQGYVSANAGIQNLEILPGYVVADGNGGNNYAASTVVNTGQITPAVLTYVNASVANKVYDSTTVGVLSFDSVTGLVGTQTPGGTPTATFASRHVGSSVGASFAANLVDGGNGFLSANYAVANVSLSADITSAILQISATDEIKTYDGGVSAIEIPLVTGLLGGDSVSGLAQIFDGQDAGAQSLSVFSFTVNDGNAGSNYSVSIVNGAGQVNPASVTVNGSVALNKVYDGLLSATLSPGTFNPLVGAETLGLAYGATFDAEHVGVNLDVTANYTLLDGTNGGFANNYTIVNVSEILQADITPASLILTASSDTRIYDATLLSAGIVSVTGLFTDDTVSGLEQQFDAPNAGSRTTQVSAFTVNDGNGGANYTVSAVTGAGSITAAALTINAVEEVRTYDGSTQSASAPVVVGLFGTDSLATATQQFDSPQAGTRIITVSSYTVSDGNSGNNYVVTSNTASGQINPAILTLAAGTASAKVYDGNSGASVVPGILTGLVGAQTLIVTSSASFLSEHVGVDRTVLANYTINDGANGGLASNYLLLDSMGTLAADITPASLILTATADDKIYDGTTSSLGSVTVDGLISDDVVIDLSQVFDLSSVGQRNTLVSTYAVLDGNGGNNYLVDLVVGAGQISFAPLQVTAADDSKFQDGRGYLGGNGIDITGFVNAEDASALSGVLSYAGDSQGAIIEGDYEIIPGGLSSSNYLIEFVPGNLEIALSSLLSGEPQPLPPLPPLQGQRLAPAVLPNELLVGPVDLRLACLEGASLEQANICAGVGDAGRE